MVGRGRMRLKVLRADRDVTQSQLARKVGIGLFRYWQIENGEGPDPTEGERKAVAAALGVKVSEVEWPEMGVRAS